MGLVYSGLGSDGFFTPASFKRLATSARFAIASACLRW